MYPYLGDFAAGSTIFIPFHTFNSSGASVTITGLAVTDIEVYKGASMTQRASDAGFALVDTDGIDLDGVTGIHGFTIDTSDNTDSGFYAAGNDYTVVVSSITADSQTVNFIAARFSIENRVSNVTKWLGTAVATPTVAGVPEVDLTHVAGSTTNVSALATNVNAILDDTGTSGVIVATNNDKTGYRLSATGVDDIWDEAYSGHMTAGSTGAALGGSITLAGTIGTGGNESTTVELPSAGRVADDDYYNNMILEVIGGTGVGQSEFISDYTSAGIATLNGTLATALDGTSIVQVRKFGTLPGASAPTAAQVADAVWDEARADHVSVGSFGAMHQSFHSGTAQAGGASTITLAASGSSSTTNFYRYAVVEIVSGTGVGQSRQITAYDGTSKVATVDPAWTTQPSTDSVYVIKGLGVDAATTSQIADAVWDEQRSGHVAAGSFGEYVLADSVRVSGSTTAADGLESAVTGATPLPANVIQISGDATAADNAEAFFDGTGYAGTNNVIPTVTNVTTVGSVTGSVGSVTGAVGSVTGSVGSVAGNVDGTIGGLNATARSHVNAEVLDVISTDTFAELSSVPAANAPLSQKIGWIFAMSRNKLTQTAAAQTLRNDGDTLSIGAASTSDDGTTFTRGEWS